MDVVGWVRSRDPGGAALKGAVRAAVAVPVVFAIGSQVIGDAQVATFGAFGTFATLIFARFPGSRTARASAYAVLAVTGAALLTLGTLVRSPDWLAVVAMAVVAFVVLFSGVLSSTVNGGTLAAMLAFILGVMLPGSRGDLPERLAGWGIAAVIAIPIALFVWPPRDQDVLRQKAAALCRALAAMLRVDPPPSSTGDRLVAMHRADHELTAAFRTASTRTAALSTGARLTVRLVDELQWTTTVVANACADPPETWPQHGLALRDISADVLAGCAETLDHDGDGPALTVCTDLDACIDRLDDARRTVAHQTVAELGSAALGRRAGIARGEFERPLYAAHELGASVALAARTVAVIGRADARSWWGKLIGRGVSAPEFGVIGGARKIAAGHLDRHSVWLQNSLRGAAGLALAVLLARVVDAQNAFWIVLGAVSVLRSNAVSTGATVVRALLGTLVGFAIGAAIVGLVGTNHALLWVLLPVAIFVAASAQAIISFVAGQAGFTVFIIILFNIIAPAGWRIGVVRVEDVALGCVASLVAGALFWPRGAAAALGNALGESYRVSADYLRGAVAGVAGRPVLDDLGALGDDASAAGLRLDDALRQYLAEQGAKHVTLEDVTALANGATRLRLAGRAIVQLDGHPRDDAAGPLTQPAAVLARRGEQVTEWYRALADGFVDKHASAPSAESSNADESFLDVVLPAVENCGAADCAGRAEQLLWSGQYLGDVDRLRAELVEPAGQVAAARALSWWRP